jgi:poly(3-hydroxybutyrate) depolymerase
MHHAFLTPVRLTAEITKMMYQHPFNPLSHTKMGRIISAQAEMLERAVRNFEKPEFEIDKIKIDGKSVKVQKQTVVEKPFCSLLHFKRNTNRHDPRVLIVAPMSGHFCSLLRGTVKDLLPHHDVFITDWIDAKQVPLNKGKFDLDSYITYIREFLSLLGPDTHVIAVCQPAVPVASAVALMEADNDPNTPVTMTLMGGPIDTRISKTEVTKLAEKRPIEWFKSSVIMKVPFHYPGSGRNVYPGFIQLGGFMSMNLDRHVGSHFKFYNHLVEGDGDSAELHRKFYNEYLSVMDITEEFYLQTVETVFQQHLLPRGKMKWYDSITNKSYKVDPAQIKNTALLTIEGELDDISAHGQTSAMHDLCINLPANRQFHHFQLNVGHYGIFNGRRWRKHIMPRIRHFIRKFDSNVSPIPASDLEIIADKKPEQWNKSKHGIEALKKRLHKKESSKVNN